MFFSQSEQKAWVQHNFGDRLSYMPLLGITEEISELYRFDPKSNHLMYLCEVIGRLNHHHLKEAQNIRLHENHKEKIKDCVADIIIFLSDYCNAREIDMAKTVGDVWDQVKCRDFKKFPNNGITE